MQFEKPTTLEGQVVDISDEIAYVAHDLVDLKNAGTITTSDIPDWWKIKFGTERKQESNTINRLVTGVIDYVAKQMTAGTYVDPSTKTIVHPEGLNKMVYNIKVWHSQIFKDKFADINKKLREYMETVFEYFLKNESKIKEYCIDYEKIKECAYSGKELVGHCIATMTDIEVINTYNTITSKTTLP